MILQFGLMMMIIWALNWLFIIIELVKHTPNWTDKDVDAGTIMANFLANTSFERIVMIEQIIKINPMLGVSGVIFVIFAILI